MESVKGKKMAKEKGSDGVGKTVDRKKMIERSEQGRINKRNRSARDDVKAATGEQVLNVPVLSVDDLPSAAIGSLLEVTSATDGTAVFEVTRFATPRSVERTLKLIRARGTLARFTGVCPWVELPLWTLTKDDFASPIKKDPAAAEKQVEMWQFVVNAMSDELRTRLATALRSHEASIPVYKEHSNPIKQREVVHQRWMDASSDIAGALGSLSLVGQIVSVRFGNTTELSGSDGFVLTIEAMPLQMRIYTTFVGATRCEEEMRFDDRAYLQCDDGIIPFREKVESIKGGHRMVALSTLDLIDGLNAKQRDLLDRGLAAAMVRVKSAHAEAKAAHQATTSKVASLVAEVPLDVAKASAEVHQLHPQPAVAPHSLVATQDDMSNEQVAEVVRLTAAIVKGGVTDEKLITTMVMAALKAHNAKVA